MLKPELIRNEKIVGVTVADRIVTFAADGGILSSPFTLSVKGKGKMQVLITDLQPGKWSLAATGSAPLAQFEVKASANTVFFVTEPGDFELRPLNDKSSIPPLPLMTG